MNISRPFIERPVATITLIFALLLFGWFAYRALPVSELPNVDFPTIVVTASLPGADPETMASTVATPLEKQLSTIAGIDSMSSVSAAGQTRITLQFVLDRDIDAAAQDVQAAISQTLKNLPAEMPNPPVLNKVNPSALPIIYFALTAEHLPLSKLDDYAETYIAERLSMVEGVAEIDVYGAQQYAVRIHLNPNALAKFGLGVDTVANAVRALNVNQPSGLLQTDSHYRSLKVDGQLNNAAEFSEAIVADVNNAPIRIKDIGWAEDSVATDKIATWINDKRAIILAVQRQPGTNTVKVVQDIKKILPTLIKEIPGNVDLKIIYDRSYFIEKSINDVQLTLLFAAILVIGVIYLFLNNVSYTLITTLVLPVSIIATFGFMYLLGYSLDNLSLMGLVLVVGFVIDDTVVVLENIVRRFEHGLDRMTAALQGAKEVGFTVVSMTLSLVAVFIPILFMGGLLGRLLNEFAMVVAIAILLSGIISLTFTPMLCSRLLPKNHTPKEKENAFIRFFEWSKKYYEKTLRVALEHEKMILLLAGGLLIATIILFKIVPKGFIPSQDADIIIGTTQVVEGTSFPDFVERQKTVANILRQNPNVIYTTSTVGMAGGAVNDSNRGQIFMGLKPRAERKLSSDEIIQQLRVQLQQAPGITVFLQNPAAIRIGGLSASGNYQYVLQGTDWPTLQTMAQKMQAEMAKIKNIQDLNSDLRLNNPEVHMHILRDRAAALGITPAQIETALYTAYGESQISTILTPSEQYKVIIDIDPQYQKNTSDLNSLYLRSNTGSMVPLASVVDMQEGVGPLNVNHYGQLPAVTLAFNLAQGVALGEVTNQIEAIAKQILPSSIIGTFAGVAQTFKSSTEKLPLLLLFTILIIYMVLAILYEHFGHPLTILTALPFAVFGALIILPLFGKSLDIFSFIGLIMLIGLVKKNGIMMVDFALEARRTENLSSKEAIIKACTIRFRPIMMTTMAAIVATLPIALGWGAGGEARQSLGIAVVGGLLFSQLLTLYVTPVFYLFMDRLSHPKNA